MEWRKCYLDELPGPGSRPRRAPTLTLTLESLAANANELLRIRSNRVTPHSIRLMYSSTHFGILDLGISKNRSREEGGQSLLMGPILLMGCVLLDVKSAINGPR